MKIVLPCRLGNLFRTQNGERRVLSGMSFYHWEGHSPGMVLCGKKDLMDKREISRSYTVQDTQEGAAITFEVPDELFMQGCPLREMGINTDANGHLAGVHIEETGRFYFVRYGDSPDGLIRRVRTEKLDKLFAPAIALCAESKSREE